MIPARRLLQSDLVKTRPIAPKTPVVRGRHGLALASLLGAAAVVATLGSCAYYNTFYIARKYYGRATQGLPYRVDRTDTPDNSNLNKSIDHSKKLMANYPKSKWVDDAYLLWAKAFLAKNDPLQTISMLQDFPTRYPTSALLGDAAFYRAVALRQARRHAEALEGFDEFLARKPRRELLPYAHLERARTLRSLERPGEAAAAAGVVVQRWPKSPLAVTARIARAESYLAKGLFEEARADFRFLGLRARTDDERLDYLLRESECLEAGRHFDEALSLLRGALGHERPPVPPDTTGGRPLIVQQTPGYDRYGRLLTRIGTAQLMSGSAEPALESYRRVVSAYPRTMVAAEAQYRVGYAYEIGADDFESARIEYGKVRDQNPSSPFVAQATQRQNTLDQLARYRAAGGDSLERRAQGGFLLAEQYLFQLDKPDRALAEYARVTAENQGSAWGGKALNAQAWVLSRKLDRGTEAESLYWKVVREYPATEAQIAARDYLEALGRTVPSELIKLPPPPEPKRDTTAARSADLSRPLTQPPAGMPPLGGGGGAAMDSAARASATRSVFGSPPLANSPGRSPFDPMRPMERDSLLRSRMLAADSIRGTMFPGTPGISPHAGTLSGPDDAAALMMAPGGVAPPDDSTGASAREFANLEVAESGPVPIASPVSPGSGSPVAAPTVPIVPGAPPSAPADTAAAAYARLEAALASAAAASESAARDSLARAAADTAVVRAPLPPLEFSPVRPGITFPSGAPRTLGAPALASSTDAGGSGPGTPASPLLGTPRSATPSDSTRASSMRAASDTLRTRQEPRAFQPRGGRFQ